MSSPCSRRVLVAAVCRSWFGVQGSISARSHALTVKDENGIVIKQRTISSDPYKVTFFPVTTGTWSVTFDWDSQTRSKNFQVQ